MYSFLPDDFQPDRNRELESPKVKFRQPEYLVGDYRGRVVREGEKGGGELTYVSPRGI